MDNNNNEKESAMKGNKTSDGLDYFIHSSRVTMKIPLLHTNHNYNQDFQDVMIFQNKISPKVYNIPYYKSIKTIQHSFLFLIKKEKKCFQRKEILHSNGLIWKVSSYEYEKKNLFGFWPPN